MLRRVYIYNDDRTGPPIQSVTRLGNHYKPMGPGHTLQMMNAQIGDIDTLSGKPAAAVANIRFQHCQAHDLGPRRASLAPPTLR